MTTENQGSLPVTPTPASSLPQQEKRWTELAGAILGKWSLCQQLGENGEYYPVGDPDDQLTYLTALIQSHATLSEPKPEMKPWLVFEDRDPKVMLAKLHIGDCALTFDVKYAGYLKVIAADRNASLALVEPDAHKVSTQDCECEQCRRMRGIPDASADNAQAVLQKTLRSTATGVLSDEEIARRLAAEIDNFHEEHYPNQDEMYEMLLPKIAAIRKAKSLSEPDIIYDQRESKAILDLCERQGLSRKQLLRQALREYQIKVLGPADLGPKLSTSLSEPKELEEEKQ